MNDMIYDTDDNAKIMQGFNVVEVEKNECVNKNIKLFS